MPQPAGNVACLHQTDSIDADCDPYQEEYQTKAVLISDGAAFEQLLGEDETL